MGCERIASRVALQKDRAAANLFFASSTWSSPKRPFSKNSSWGLIANDNKYCPCYQQQKTLRHLTGLPFSNNATLIGRMRRPPMQNTLMHSRERNTKIVHGCVLGTVHEIGPLTCSGANVAISKKKTHRGATGKHKFNSKGAVVKTGFLLAAPKRQ